MDIINKVVKRIGEAVVDAVMLMVGHAINVLVLLVTALLVSFIPVWLVLAVIIALSGTIGYLTYKEELDNIDEE